MQVKLIHEDKALDLDLLKVEDIVELQIMAQQKFTNLPPNFIITDHITGQVLTKKKLQDIQQRQTTITILRVKGSERVDTSISSLHFEQDDQLEYINSHLDQLEEQRSQEESFLRLDESNLSSLSPQKIDPDSKKQKNAQRVGEPNKGQDGSFLDKIQYDFDFILGERHSDSDYEFEPLPPGDWSQLSIQAWKDKQLVDARAKSLSKEKEFKPKERIIVNEDIQCDGCYAFPIQGTLYKCLVCANYDLCVECEKKRIHCFHPSLQIKRSDMYPTNLKVTFDEQSENHMNQAKKKSEQEVKRFQDEEKKKKRPKEEQVDPSTLKQSKVKGKNFLAALGLL